MKLAPPKNEYYAQAPSKDHGAYQVQPKQDAPRYGAILQHDQRAGDVTRHADPEGCGEDGPQCRQDKQPLRLKEGPGQAEGGEFSGLPLLACDEGTGHPPHKGNDTVEEE